MLCDPLPLPLSEIGWTTYLLLFCYFLTFLGALYNPRSIVSLQVNFFSFLPFKSIQALISVLFASVFQMWLFLELLTFVQPTVIYVLAHFAKMKCIFIHHFWLNISWLCYRWSHSKCTGITNRAANAILDPS